MNEMMANYKFLIRNYQNAANELIEVVRKDPLNKKARKKLIICFTQTNQLEKALNLFINLISEDLDFIINTNPEYEDCPCPDLVSKIESGEIERRDISKLYVELGILWLFCNPEKSLENFIKAYEINPENELLKIAIEKISTRVN